MKIFQKPQHYIGLHINAHALKALQFDIGHTQTNIQALANVTMPKGVVTNDEFTDISALTKLLEKSLTRPQHGNFSTKRVVVSIPESKSFVRVIPLQNMSEAQIGNAIIFEVESYIPLPIDQVYLDWQVLSQTKDGLEILVIASPREYIDKYLKVLEGAGLQVIGIETEAQSVARALVPQTVKEPILIADMDAFKTALIMVQDATLQFTSSVPIAGNSFTELLVKNLSLQPETAEKLKQQIGFANTVEYPNFKLNMLPAMKDLAEEIKNILKFHYEHHENHIGKLLLTGGAAKLQNIAQELEPMLADYAPLEVTVANPLQHVPNYNDQALGPYEALSFTTAIGLAMWEVK